MAKQQVPMKLENYFNEQKMTNVSEAQKFSIYQKITEGKNKTSYKQRKGLLHVHVKSFIYGLTITTLLVALYGTFIIENPGENGIAVIPKNIQRVHADYIANIVNFNGDYYIEHNGKRIQTSNIHNGDTVSLDKDTELIFHIDEKTQAKIKGPALFKLEKDKDLYTLNLIKGDFLEIQSLQDKNTQEIKVLSDSFSVYQDKSKSKVNFQVINKGKTHIITNKGNSKISVTQNHKHTEIKKSELVTIEQDDITLLTVKEFNKAIKNKKITQTFSRKNNQEKDKESITGHELT
ncbi:MAG: hypothetical protein GXP45_03850 [bacterium]|nr:hypothetical protein [bacterium]